MKMSRTHIPSSAHCSKNRQYAHIDTTHETVRMPSGSCPLDAAQLRFEDGNFCLQLFFGRLSMPNLRDVIVADFLREIDQLLAFPFQLFLELPFRVRIGSHLLGLLLFQGQEIRGLGPLLHIPARLFCSQRILPNAIQAGFIINDRGDARLQWGDVIGHRRGGGDVRGCLQEAVPGETAGV